jgi:Ca2+-transporting ATPase
VLQGAVLVTASCLAAGWWALSHDAHVPTAVFLTLGWGQLTVALALRSPRRRGWHPRERWLEVAVVVAVLAQLAGVLVPALADLLGAEGPPEPGHLAVLALLGAAPGLATALLVRRGRVAG